MYFAERPTSLRIQNGSRGVKPFPDQQLKFFNLSIVKYLFRAWKQQLNNVNGDCQITYRLTVNMYVLINMMQIRQTAEKAPGKKLHVT